MIAQKSIRPRDNSRLLILEKKTGKIRRDYFFNLGKYLKKGDVLVLNNSRVFPARLIGNKLTGGKAEIVLVKKKKMGQWEVLTNIKKAKKNLEIGFGKKRKLKAKLIKKLNNGNWLIQFNPRGKNFRKAIQRFGQAPTPPYIKRISNLEEYQTIYAEKNGSIAAPTAGFHFTKKLIKKLKNQGIKFKFITLHVGPGTFLPIKTERIEKHQMLAETAIINGRTAAELNKIKNKGGRIIAVGTTSVRTLETVASSGKIKKFVGQTNIYIKPGYKFEFIDGLITNFHLPKSTNLVLVSTLAGRKKIKKAYQEAIKRKYRFYSFGDAMLII